MFTGSQSGQKLSTVRSVTPGHHRLQWEAGRVEAVPALAQGFGDHQVHIGGVDHHAQH